MYKLEGQRIRQLREECGLNQKEFAEALNLKQGYVSQVETGKVHFSYEILRILYQKYKYNLLYHVSGIGKPIIDLTYNSEGSNIGLKEPTEDYKPSRDTTKLIEELEKEIKELKEELSKNQKALIETLQKLVSVQEQSRTE